MTVAIYSRKSKFTGRGESVENQIALCREHALRQYGEDCSLLVYEDEGYSASDTCRPMFQAMMRDAGAGRFQVLLCYRLDRISRSVSDFSLVLQQLEKLGVDFVSLRESFDTSTPMGRAMIYIASVFAQLERETIAERIRDNKQKLAHLGRWQGGTPPMGYRSRQKVFPEGGKNRVVYSLEEDDLLSPPVRELFDHYLLCRSLTRLEDYAARQGILSPKGNALGRSVLREMLKNPVYAVNTPEVFDHLQNAGVILANDREKYDGKGGLLSYRKTAAQGKKRQRLEQSQWIVAVGEHRGLIEGENWVRAQRLLEAGGKKPPRQNTGKSALLSGLLVCGQCGGCMRVRGNRRLASGEENFYYVCSRKAAQGNEGCPSSNISGPLLDRLVSEKLTGLLSALPSPSLCREEVQPVSRRLEEEEKRQRDVLLAIRRLTEQMAQSDEEEAAALRRVAAQLEEQRQEGEGRLSRLRPSAPQQFALSPVTRWEQASLQEKRVLLRHILRRIVWTGDGAQLWFCSASESNSH